jgi:hypothetical protein
MNDFIFIYDSGSKLWDTPYARDFVDHPPVRTNINRHFWEKNYFVLAGLYIDGETIAKLNPFINEKKKEVFGTKYAEIHSNDLRNPRQRRKVYVDSFGVTEDELKDFVENFWYRIFSDNPQIKIQAIVLDKRYYKYQRRDHSPLELTVQALFDRIEKGPNRTSRIVFDQMDSEVKSKKRDQGKILKIANHEINLGALFEKYSHASISFERSEISNFLQLADTVVYNVLRQFVDHGDLWSDANESRIMYPYFERILGNFYRSENGRVKGIGIVKLPDPHLSKK